MTTIVLVGGNGYIGREITRQWLARDPQAQLYITSRSDRREVVGENIHHVQVDVNDAAAFEAALPEQVDYVVNLTYGSDAAIESVRSFAEKHGAQAIGNVNAVVKDEAFADFVAMKAHELELLRQTDVRVENVDLTVAYGAGRNDEIAQGVKAGYMNSLPPVHVEIVAREVIDQLTQAWLA